MDLGTESDSHQGRGQGDYCGGCSYGGLPLRAGGLPGEQEMCLSGALCSKQEVPFPATKFCCSKSCCCTTLKIWRNNTGGPDSVLIWAIRRDHF